MYFEKFVEQFKRLIYVLNCYIFTSTQSWHMVVKQGLISENVKCIVVDFVEYQQESAYCRAGVRGSSFGKYGSINN